MLIDSRHMRLAWNAWLQGVEFSAYIRGEGYQVIPILAEHQLAYACNVLNLVRGGVSNCLSLSYDICVASSGSTSLSFGCPCLWLQCVCST